MTSERFRRWRIEPARVAGRTLDDRLRASAPKASSSLAATVLRALPAGSRIRKAALTRAVRAGFAAIGRRDYDLWRLAYDPGVEFHARGTWRSLGLPEVTRGVNNVWGIFDFMREAFGDLRLEPREIVDAGGSSFATRVALIGTGHGSGIETRQEVWYVYRLAGGRIVSQHALPTESEALDLLSQPRNARLL
jgi:ketosteroid isomerase-like protein